MNRDVATVMAAARPLLDRLPEGRRRSAQAAMTKAVHARLARHEESADRLADRVSRRLRLWMLEDVTDPVGWFTGYALKRRGCADPMCEDGLIADTGADCRVCSEVGGKHAPAPEGRPMPECARCEVPLRNRDAPEGTLCRSCHEQVLADQREADEVCAKLAAQLGVSWPRLAA